MTGDTNSSFEPTITQIQQTHHQETPTFQLQEQEQFTSLFSVTTQDSVESSDITSSTSKQEGPIVMETGLSFLKEMQGFYVKNECESISNFTEEKQDLGQEFLASVNEKVTACDLVQAFGVEVEETANGELGCVADVENTVEDSVKLEVGCSRIQECDRFSEEGSEVEVYMSSLNEEVTSCDLVSRFSGCEVKDVVCERKVAAFGVEVEETGNSEGGCAADVEKTLKDSVNLEVGCSGIQECDKFNEEKKSKVEDEMRPVMEGDNEEGKKLKSEALLEAKKKQLLAEIEVSGLASFSQIYETSCQEVHRLEQNNGERIDGIRESALSVRPSLKIEVIDDTALIESVGAPVNGNGCVKEMGMVGTAKMMGRNRKKGEKEQEVDGKKAKRSRRKPKDTKKVSGMSERLQNLTDNVDDQDGGLKNGKQSKIMYTMKELEALRFVNIVEQRKMWRDIYTGLGPVVMNEYDEVASSKHQKHFFVNLDPRHHLSRKSEAQGILGEDYSQNVDNALEVNVDTMNPACSHSTEVEDSYQQGECSEDYDTDEDYASIQRPAFFVEGEPDFDSGPPEDGFEYLRRVRWEAAHIPKVKVAKLDGREPYKEQSIYMPQIPDIAQCSEHLMPLKQWEDLFLADFSKLRQVLSGIENSNTRLAGKLQEMVMFPKENDSCQLSESVTVEKFNNIKTKEVIFCQPVDSFSHESAIGQLSVLKTEDDEITDSQQSPKTSPSDDSCNYPTLSAILEMDSIARVSMLRKRIRLVETSSTFSRNDCVWLFALCAAVDTPLDADTCAAIRGLLRKCASLRAGKSELDDEVVMLNILATISGRYFGQAED